jgi:hypothetical protein
MRTAMSAAFFVICVAAALVFALYGLWRFEIASGIQHDLFWAGFIAFLLGVRWLIRKTFWHAGAAAMVCDLLAYAAWLEHNVRAQHVFASLSSAVVLLGTFDGDGKWRKKLWGRIRSGALTAVNAARFRRQTKEAFSCSRG